MKKVSLKGWAAFFIVSVVLITALLKWWEDNGEIPFLSKEKYAGGSINLWYFDAALTDELTAAAADYYEKTGMTVIPSLQSGAGYINDIFEASSKKGGVAPPDLYILKNDDLWEAYAFGILSPVDNDGDIINEDNFPSSAIDAVSCAGIYAGFPLYFETTALLYNKGYMDQAVISAAMKADAETVGAVTEVEDADAEVSVKEMTMEDAIAAGYSVEAILPSTVEGILEFADNYDAPMDVEYVFKWDVNDIFYNYYFPGAYMDVGGPCGDDPSIINIDNENVRECLSVYQTLNQFFSIETSKVDYNSVIKDFMEGKVVMTVATSDAVATLNKAAAQGEFEHEYETMMVPDITDELKSRSLSVTSALVVNDYSDKKNEAVSFVEYYLDERLDGFYDHTGRIPAKKGVSLPDERLKAYVKEYEKSVSVPKFPGASSFWIELETACARIWEGESIEPLLEELQEKMDSYR